MFFVETKSKNSLISSSYTEITAAQSPTLFRASPKHEPVRLLGRISPSDLLNSTRHNLNALKSLASSHLTCHKLERDSKSNVYPWKGDVSQSLRYV